MMTACADIRDRLPDWVAGRLAASEADRVTLHVRGCADCAAEAELLRGLVATHPSAPAELASRIVAAARAEHAPGTPTLPGVAPRLARPRTRAWTLTAAALLVLAVGITVLSPRRNETQPEAPVASPVTATLGDVPVEDNPGAQNAVWISDDAEVAGAPVLDGLSDDNLAALLEEMGG